jgi:hypothetical protein
VCVCVCVCVCVQGGKPLGIHQVLLSFVPLHSENLMCRCAGLFCDITQALKPNHLISRGPSQNLSRAKKKHHHQVEQFRDIPIGSVTSDYLDISQGTPALNLRMPDAFGLIRVDDRNVFSHIFFPVSFQLPSLLNREMINQRQTDHYQMFWKSFSKSSNKSDVSHCFIG